MKLKTRQQMKYTVALVKHAKRAATYWWVKHRTASLSISGFGFLCAAAWDYSRIAGLIAIGTSILVIETLSGEGKK